MQIIEHIDGNHQNHDLKNLRLGTLPRCEDCTGMISADRLRWFAKNRPGVTPRQCGNCAFAKRAEAAKQRSESGQ